MRANVWGWAFAAALPVVAAGCGNSNADRPETYPVSGVVTYKGLPVPDAQVTFSPEGQGQAAFGRTDTEGKYSLTTYESGDGAVAGRYKVAVTKFDAPEQPAAPTGGEYVPPAAGKYQKVAKPKNHLPAKYATPQSSDLQAEVKPEATTFDITIAG
jgi:hypothetical protein